MSRWFRSPSRANCSRVLVQASNLHENRSLPCKCVFNLFRPASQRARPCPMRRLRGRQTRSACRNTGREYLCFYPMEIDVPSSRSRAQDVALLFLGGAGSICQLAFEESRSSPLQITIEHRQSGIRKGMATAANREHQRGGAEYE